jgi:hypothetical protein
LFPLCTSVVNKYSIDVNKSANNVDEVCKEGLVSIHQQRERKAT